MSSTSQVITLAGLIIAIFAICNAKKVSEGFGFGQQGVMWVDTIRGEVPKNQMQALRNMPPAYRAEAQAHAALNNPRAQSVMNPYQALINQRQNSSGMSASPMSANQQFMAQNQNKFLGSKESFNNQRAPHRPIQGTETARIGEFYQIPGTYQGSLSPRFANVDYGANISYNMPDVALQGSPINPLTFSNMTKENYTRENFDGCAGKGTQYQGSAPIAPANYAAGNYNEILGGVYAGSSDSKAVNDIQVNLPVRDMTLINPEGGEDTNMQPVIYDRYIVANIKSQQAALGDFFRGDLPIVPNNNGWFNTSYAPQKDLQKGAMAVMGGLYNDTTRELADLVNVSSGGASTTISGMNLQPHFAKQQAIRQQSEKAGRSLGPYTTIDLGNQYTSQLNVVGDVSAVAFP